LQDNLSTTDHFASPPPKVQKDAYY